jgi:hypothetical protein
VKLLGEGRRRLAVIDESGRLLGLLCLNREGTGYCSDDGILKRLNSQAATGRGAYIRA